MSLLDCKILIRRKNMPRRKEDRHSVQVLFTTEEYENLKRYEALKNISMSSLVREYTMQGIRGILTQENIDFLASCPHEIREDLALVYGFHVLVDGEKAGSAIINYDRLRWLGVSEEQLKQDAWENMKQSNPPCFLDLQDMLAKMYSDELGDVKAGSLEYLEDVDPNAMMYVLTNSN